MLSQGKLALQQDRQDTGSHCVLLLFSLLEERKGNILLWNSLFTVTERAKPESRAHTSLHRAGCTLVPRSHNGPNPQQMLEVSLCRRRSWSRMPGTHHSVLLPLSPASPADRPSLALIVAWWRQKKCWTLTPCCHQRKWRWWCETGRDWKDLESPLEPEGVGRTSQ